MTDELEQMSPNQRRALNKALSALETFASIWAAEIRLSEVSARIALLPDEAERAKRIAAMIEQGFIEGAYRHHLDHKDKCDEIAATRDDAPQAAQKDADHIVDANKKVDAQSVRDAWQPIETAPKDGSEIVCLDDWFGKPWRYVAIWNGIQWYSGFGDTLRKPNPTHWMPMPAPPQKPAMR